MRNISIPTFGTFMPEHGGHFGAILRGAAADGSQDYVVIVPAADGAEITATAWSDEYNKIEGADSQHDGRANTAAMAAAGIKLGQQVAALDLHGHKDWYLPAAAELRALSATVPELLDKDDWYWSSTQYSRHGAWFQDFEYGLSSSVGKDLEPRVRPVRQIPLHTFIA